MTGASHELVYFDGEGRAEATRILLHAAGVDFKDTRFKFNKWPEIKSTTPLGSVPVLKIGGTCYCQSIALARYAAKLAGFYPEDPLEALAVDEAMDCLSELMAKAPRGATDKETKKAREEYQKTTMTKYAGLFEKRIQAGGGCGFVASGVSVADLILFAQVKSTVDGKWDYIDTTFFDTYPGITKTAERVQENPKVKAYYASSKK